MSTTWPGLRAPIIFAAVTGILTYLIILNLETLSRICQSSIKGPKSFLLQKMKPPIENKSVGDRYSQIPNIPPHSSRANRATHLDISPRLDEIRMTSNCWFLVFALVWMCTALGKIAPPVWRMLQRQSKTSENADVMFVISSNLKRTDNA